MKFYCINIRNKLLVLFVKAKGWLFLLSFQAWGKDWNSRESHISRKIVLNIKSQLNWLPWSLPPCQKRWKGNFEEYTILGEYMTYIHMHIYMHTHSYEKIPHTSLSPIQVQKECSHLTLITTKKANKKRWCLRVENSKSVTLGLLFYNLHTTNISTAYAAWNYTSLDSSLQPTAPQIVDKKWCYSVADKNKTHYICSRKYHWKAADRSSLPAVATAQSYSSPPSKERLPPIQTYNRVNPVRAH